ncbi:hypothetical protein VMUT_1841 [Vulcanisaeta moutnovskia 768-28]|uniref:Uncharacterized protein n=1 Tax=Vulcanisaeta moutnovskia (strain 768-28) TaxID=985053 RepID=F0QVE0_VULM7|nr:hypothetical protein [Vulcanisaeta moutnovskia]ADY02042.1 hypothetical protein VMUT_1841 [Vulcanisaeta moutnovskia 768-28]
MSKAQGVRAWHVLLSISLLLYLANASILIYFQFEYYENTSFIESIMSSLPSIYISAQINEILQQGFIGLLGTISIILVLIMMYLITSTFQGKSHEIGRSMRVVLLILLLIQIFLGNTGLLLGLIIGLVGLALMR